MTIDLPQSDLARVLASEPNRDWPLLIQIAAVWKLPDGSMAERTRTILADEFFGRGKFGAPMPAEALAATIESMRRDGPPERSAPKKRSRAGSAKAPAPLRKALRDAPKPQSKRKVRR